MKQWRSALALVALGCHRDHPVAVGEDVVAAAVDAPPLPRCARAAVRWNVRADTADAGDTQLAPIESASLTIDRQGRETVLWTDRRDRAVHLATARSSLRMPSPTGEHSDPVTAAGAVAVSSQAAGARTHALRAGAALGAVCEQPEGVDESFSLAMAAVGPREHPSVLLAWDEPGHQGDAGMNAQAPPGTIYAQVASIDHNGVSPGHICPAARALSGGDQDAEDPMAVSLPSGGAAVFWWASRDVAADENNDTVSELWGVAVAADGRPLQRAIRIAGGDAHRFGLSASVTTDGQWIWLAMREGSETGSEARGDGGEVVAMRVDARVTQVGAAVTVTVPESNPTGSPSVIAGSAGAEVWWVDRHEGVTAVVRRALRASGEPVGAPQEEPALVTEGADLPRYALGAERVTLLRAGGRGVGVARFLCGRL